MTTRRLAVLSATVLALFAFIFFFERHQPTTEERLERGDVLWDLNEGKVGRISVGRGAETLEFGRDTDDSWRMTRPDSYPADAGLMSSLVYDLARPQRMGEATEGVSGPDYGLMKPRVVVTVTAKEEKGKKPESHTLSIGSEVPGTDTVAARVQGENRIVFIRSSVATDLLKPADAFWSRRVFTGASADVTRLSISRGRGQINFEKRKGSWWMVRPIADLADATSLDRLVGDLIAENVTEFLKVSDADLSGDGLQPAIYTVTMTTGKKTQTLEIGASRADGKSVYARANGRVFGLDSSITEELSKEADAYRESKLVRYESGDVKGITFSSEGRTRAITRDGPDWVESGKTLPASGVEDVLTAVSALAAKDFLSADESAAAQANPETANLKLDLKSGDPWTISFRPYRDKQLAAKVGGRPSLIAVDSADFDRLTAQLRKLAPAAPPAKATPKKK